MEGVVRALNLEYNFAPGSCLNTPISIFLKTDLSETSFRPVYYTIKKVKLWDKVWIAVYLSLFFEVNPGYKFGIGYHKGDVEKLILLYEDDDAGKPSWVYFSAHGNGQGIWKEYKDCEFTTDGALRIFVSPCSNAHYRFEI